MRPTHMHARKEWEGQERQMQLNMVTMHQVHAWNYQRRLKDQKILLLLVFHWPK